jgi:hypothetical protein
MAQVVFTQGGPQPTPPTGVTSLYAKIDGKLYSKDPSGVETPLITGGGSVTDVSVATANGFTGTVATSTSTPIITITTDVTGLLKGDGVGLSDAIAGTDYIAPNGDIGTPSNAVLTNATGLPPSGVTGTALVLGDIGVTVQAYDVDLGTWGGIIPAAGVGTALALNVGSVGSFVTNGGALGTPASGTLTNVTGLPIGGIVATGTPSNTTYLRGDGTWATVSGGGGGSGDVSGPGTSTVGFVPTWNNGSGTLLAAGLAAPTSGTLVSSVTALPGAVTGTPGATTFLRGDGTWAIPAGGGGAGSVTQVSVVSANGFAGTVANDTTTPAITLTTNLTGLLKGNGTAMSVATAGTDYVVPGGALGTPSSGTLTNATGLPIAGVVGLQDDLDGKTDASGFPVDASGNYLVTLTYNETTRTVTVTPTGATFDFYCTGVKYTKTGAQTIVHTATQGGHFLYYDTTGTLVESLSPWDLLHVAPVCYVFWDSVNSKAIPFDERHHAGRDVYWHRNQHAAEGTKITSGFSASGYTLNAGSTDAAVTFAISTGRVEDEDIRIDTVALVDGGPYNIITRTGASGDWVMATDTFPFLRTGANLQYNQFTGATWQQTNLAEDTFTNVYVFAATALPPTDITPAPTANDQYIFVPGQAVFASQALADAEVVSALQWGSMPFQEIAPIYKVTLRFNASPPSAYTNTCRCAIVAFNRIVGSFASIAVATQTDHGALTGLADQDHPASAIIFTPAGSIVATDVQAALVELDADISAIGGGGSSSDPGSAIFSAMTFGGF